MEEIQILKMLGQYGLVGIMLGIALMIIYKYGGKIFTAYISFNEKLFENSLKHTEATNELAKNVSNTNAILQEKLTAIVIKIDNITTKEETKKNHKEVMDLLQTIKQELQNITQSKNN